MSSAGTYRLRISPSSGAYAPSARNLCVEFTHVAGMPKAVTFNGTTLKKREPGTTLTPHEWFFDASSRKVCVVLRDGKAAMDIAVENVGH